MTSTTIQRAAAAAALLAASSLAFAQAWPSRPITVIVPFAAGGNNDVSGRIVAQKLAEILGQPVVVENRTGAAGAIGAAAVATAKPDGYTLGFLSSGPVAANVSLYKSLAYDPRRDFAPVVRVTTSPSVLVVNPALPVKDVAGFIDYAKNNPGKLNYGTAGNGSSPHLAGALFESMAQVRMTAVPYRGGAPALADVMGGQTQAVFNPILEVMPHVKAGKVRALAVTTGKRSALLPDLPALGERFPGYEVLTWNGFLAPAGTPPEVVEKFHQAVRKALEDPQVVAKLVDLGLEVAPAGPAEFSDYIRRQIDHFANLARIARVEPQ